MTIKELREFIKWTRGKNIIRPYDEVTVIDGEEEITGIITAYTKDRVIIEVRETRVFDAKSVQIRKGK
ncbi:hypothetical protein BpsM61_00035 [Bacillus phage vB_BpsM-61]|nr:hypothetical protein BpsM61_00035 [Bacillus phage vB_BpsM-61]